MVVVLPAPLGPMTPKTSPLSSFIDRDFTAKRSPYFFVKSRVSITSLSWRSGSILASRFYQVAVRSRSASMGTVSASSSIGRFHRDHITVHAGVNALCFVGRRSSVDLHRGAGRAASGENRPPKFQLIGQIGKSLITVK